MATPDMDVIKEIPGYKVILKAVLKSQIQQLVEQLASHTDEESVILTASLSDGTLSHLGSDSGKFFINDNEDFKSQFLGFCLKRHHKKKQEKEREEREEALRVTASQYGMRSPTGPRYMQRSPRMPSPRQQGVHPVAISRGMGPRVPLRHEPYPVTRPRRPAQNVEKQIKQEPEEGNDTIEISESSQTASQIKQDSEREDDAKSNSSSSTLPNDAQDMKFTDTQPAGGLSLDSDFSNLLAGDNSQQSDSNTPKDNASDSDVSVSNIKMEAISEADMELEITGVEPGRPMVPQDNWGPNTTGGYDQSGATGSSADVQGYRSKESVECPICGKYFSKKFNMEMHTRIHTGVKPYGCEVCGRRFTQKGTLKAHMITHMNLKL